MLKFQIILKSLVVTLILLPQCVKTKTVDTTTIATVDTTTMSNDTKNNSYDSETNANKGDVNPNEVNATCKGDPVYCNLSKEEYIQMLDNYIFPSPHEWGLIAMHSVVFVIGLVGNALVCIAVFRNASMRSSVTYCCLVNLAVADFLVILLCLPPTVAWDVTETWFLGEMLCKTLVYFQSVSVTVSVLTLTYIALDRYYAIKEPIHFHVHTSIKSRQVKIAIVIIWIIALVFNCPDLIYLRTTQQTLRFELPHMVQCAATWSEEEVLVWQIVKFVFIYTVPLLLIAGAYFRISLNLWRSGMIPGQADSNQLTHEAQQRSRRNVAKIVVVVVVMFAVCYLPVHVLALLRYTGVLNNVNDHDVISAMALVSHVLCYVNSAINPVIYNFMSKKFRLEFRRAFCCSTGYLPEHSTTMTLTTKSKRSMIEMHSITHKHEKNGYA